MADGSGVGVSVLLRQPHGFAGLVDVQIYACSRDPIVASKVRDDRGRELDGDTARTPPSLDAGGSDHRLVNLTHTLEVDLPLSKLLVHVAHPLLYPCVTSVRLAGY